MTERKLLGPFEKTDDLSQTLHDDGSFPLVQDHADHYGLDGDWCGSSDAVAFDR